MPAGRPTKYTKAMQTLAEDYLENHDVKYGDVVPHVAGLSLELDVTRSTVYLWAEQHEEFSDTLRKIQAKQEKGLVSGGLMKEFDSGISKLMLHNHNYSDKKEMDVTTKGEAITLSEAQLDQIIQERARRADSEGNS